MQIELSRSQPVPSNSKILHDAENVARVEYEALLYLQYKAQPSEVGARY